MTQRLDNRVIIGILIAVVVVLVVQRRDALWHGPGAEPEIMSIEDDDAEMNAAMAKARESVQTFLQALESPSGSRSYLSVKVRFRDDNGGEYMWLNDVHYRHGSFCGTVGNTPNTVRSVRFGDAVTVPKDQIADWMFIDDGKPVGGYTMRVMRSRLSPEDRPEFDENIGFTIDD